MADGSPTIHDDYEKLRALAEDLVAAFDRMANGQVSLNVRGRIEEIRAHLAVPSSTDPADDAASPTLEAPTEPTPTPESPTEPAPEEPTPAPDPTPPPAEGAPSSQPQDLSPGVAS